MSKEISIGKVTCNSCGKEFYYTGNFTGQVSSNRNNPDKLGEWIHEFSVNRPGYGSVFDECKFEFHLCDDCLEDLVKNMEERPSIDSNFGESYYDRKFQDNVEVKTNSKEVTKEHVEKIRERFNRYMNKKFNTKE